MTRLKIAILAIVFLSVPIDADAQCRQGSGPDHGDGIPYCSQTQSPPATPSGPQWAMRWGAIAYGGGGFGAAKDMTTLSKAKKAALRECRDSGGGKQCKLAISYSNQCAAYAIGDDYSVGVARSASSEEAYALATASCAESTTNCRVTYSACSLPARIK